MSVDHVVLVHGYSVRTLDAYAQFPALLAAEGYANAAIVLSAFNSLDDAITCDDLAVALENHVSQLETRSSDPVDISASAFVCHSTGAIVTRRWILNRLAAGKSIPSHLITMAGANHGSTLAQLGETIAAHVFRKINGNTSVGSGVLTDLDYGSTFLLRLNREWLVQANAGSLAPLYVFSMGGDSVGDWLKEIIWQTKEPGSDSTVRISGANLNYRILDADAGTGSLVPLVPRQEVPHLVLHGYSHTGALGIIDAVTKSTDPPFAALLQALLVESPAEYSGVLEDWRSRTQAWTTSYADQCDSTLVFSLRDRAERPINDSLIVLGDSSGDAGAMSASFVNRPIQNEAVHSSVSFYLNQPHFAAAGSHTVHIEARSGSDEIDYRNVDYVSSPDICALVMPVQTTYVNVTIDRNTDKTYALYTYGPDLDTRSAWPPFPPTDQIPFLPSG
jgi:hypothetical protein